MTTGSHLLINGGTGGVGHFAIQLAKGAVVTVTCSEANRDLAKNLGTAETFGYKREELAKITEVTRSIIVSQSLRPFVSPSPLSFLPLHLCVIAPLCHFHIFAK